MTNYNLNSLSIFYEVAKQKSISKASENLFISQPAVSQSIKKLEEEIGGTLFNRSNKGISLTQEGEVFFKYVDDAFNKIKKGEDEFLNFKQLKCGTIKIGVSTTLAKICLLNPIQNFHKDYPNIKIDIVNNVTSKIIDMAINNEIDIAIYLNEKNDNSIKQLTYCFAFNNTFFNLEKKLELKQLQNYPLIVQNKESVTRKIFNKFVDESKMKITPYMEVVSQELVSVFAGCGLGIGFVLEEFLKYSNLSLNVVKINETMPKAYVCIKTSPFGECSFATKKFIEYI